MKLNKYKSNPVSLNKMNWGEANMIKDLEEFQRIADFGFKLGKIELTPRGNISTRRLLAGGAAWVNENSKNSFEFIIYHHSKLYRFVYRPKLVDNSEMEYTGYDALKVLRRECGELLKPYEETTTERVSMIKEKIPKVMIYLTELGELLRGQEIENVFHMDLNSAFPAGVVEHLPELRPFYEKHYKLRKTEPIHKAIMNYSIGAAQSLKIPGKRYPSLAFYGITWTNERLLELTKKVEAKGYKVLGYNTDGLFVLKTKPDMPLYTDEDEGLELGQWKISHVFDKLRFKSAGSYEYVENGKYHAVVRGATVLERTKPRETWEWGDIFKAGEIRYLRQGNKIIEVSYEEE